LSFAVLALANTLDAAAFLAEDVVVSQDAAVAFLIHFMDRRFCDDSICRTAVAALADVSSRFPDKSWTLQRLAYCASMASSDAAIRPYLYLLLDAAASALWQTFGLEYYKLLKAGHSTNGTVPKGSRATAAVAPSAAGIGPASPDTSVSTSAASETPVAV
jgi:hypothetical protein